MKIVLFKNTVESQEFFSFELAQCFKELGHSIFIYDCADPITSKGLLDDFAEPGNTVFFSFNFNGMINDPLLCEKDGKDPAYLRKTGIPVINMVVDHPYYYHKEFVYLPEKYIQISIDENHAAYMRKYFPKIQAQDIVYLGGTQLIPYVSGTFDEHRRLVRAGEDDLIPFEKREDDIIFCGNYMRPEYFEKYLRNCEQGVVDFYHEILEELKHKPEETLESVAERKIRNEFGDEATDEYIRDCLENMIFLDLQIRHFYRGCAVAALADAGVKITVYGEGYDQLSCSHPENLKIMGNVDSIRCLKAIANARISLNVMPWFKKGGHDRVYNTCLNGAVCLSDRSEALSRQFTDLKDIVFFDMKGEKSIRESVVEKYFKLSEHPGEMKAIAESGYENARKNHSWYERSKEIEKILIRSLE